MSPCLSMCIMVAKISACDWHDKKSVDYVTDMKDAESKFIYHKMHNRKISN